MGERRTWQEREMRLVAEYLHKFHPKATTMTRVRLGAVPHLEVPADLQEEAARIAGVVRAWADGVALYPARTVIVEGAIRPTWGEESKLIAYARLFRMTQEFRDRWELPIEMELVYVVEHPLAMVRVREAGIRVVQYSPPWILDYLKILYPRERSVPRMEG